MKKLISIFLISIISINLYISIGFSQSIYPYVIAASGDYFSDGTNELSWTLGEIATETFSSVNNILTQGFQQPSYNNYTIITENKTPNTNICIYPNPVNDNLFIELTTPKETVITIKLTDLLGKIINTPVQLENKGTIKKYSINIKDLQTGIYLLQIVSNDYTISETYKIIKVL